MARRVPRGAPKSGGPQAPNGVNPPLGGGSADYDENMTMGGGVLGIMTSFVPSIIILPRIGKKMPATIEK